MVLVHGIHLSTIGSWQLVVDSHHSDPVSTSTVEASILILFECLQYNLREEKEGNFLLTKFKNILISNTFQNFPVIIFPIIMYINQPGRLKSSSLEVLKARLDRGLVNMLYSKDSLCS